MSKSDTGKRETKMKFLNFLSIVPIALIFTVGYSIFADQEYITFIYEIPPKYLY